MKITILTTKERRPVEIDAKALDIPGFPNLAIHRTHFGQASVIPASSQKKYYTISETTTGLLIYSSNAPQGRDYAIAKATQMLKIVGPEKFAKYVSEAPKL